MNLILIWFYCRDGAFSSLISFYHRDGAPSSLISFYNRDGVFSLVSFYYCDGAFSSLISCLFTLFFAVFSNMWLRFLPECALIHRECNTTWIENWPDGRAYVIFTEIWTPSSHFYKNRIINASGVTAAGIKSMFCMKLCLIQKQNGGTSLRRESNRERSCARLFNKPVFFFVTKVRVLETYIVFLHWIAFCGKETQSNFRIQVHLPSKDETYHNRWFCYCFLFVRKKLDFFMRTCW